MTTDITGGQTGGSETSDTGVQERAKEAAAEVGAGAKNVAGVAKDEASSVAHQAKSAARGLLSDARTQLSDQASNQKQRAADGLRNVGSQLSSMAEGTDSGVAGDIVRNISRRADSAASWLSDREPADLVDEVRRFARRNTAAFLAIAAGIGVLAGRAARALREGEPDDTGSTSGSYAYATGSNGSTGVSAYDDTPVATAVASGRGTTAGTAYGDSGVAYEDAVPGATTPGTVTGDAWTAEGTGGDRP
ncbi:hypothetical protein ACFUTX_01485 [Microbacterium sp. NPDC057407]|uniref:hypothetical protein n=1 Tax=Microbacterium sp. NPDC057407 TaxID=3346120 RepID=UPI00366BBB94